MRFINTLFIFLILVVVFVAIPSCGDDDDDDHSVSTEDDDSSSTEDDDATNTDDDTDQPWPSPGLSREDFSLLVDGGIDDRINSYPWAISLFDGDKDGIDEIYIGTIANALCLQIPMIPFLFSALPNLRPPAVWQCDTDHWDANNWLPYYVENLAPATVFRGVYQKQSDSWTWKRVFEPKLAECGGFRGSIVYHDALYMLGTSKNGAYVWKSSDGLKWEKASEPGVIQDLAGYNKFLRAAVVFKDKLYVSSSDPTSSYIFVSSDPSPGNWEAANSNGFVDSGGNYREWIESSGRSTGENTSASLTDHDSSWIPFYYSGSVFSVRLTGGKGAGQIRQIKDNIGNTLFVAEPWDVIPDETTTYDIYRPEAPDNGPIYQMAVFNDRLCAAPLNYHTGGELWCSADPAPGNWERVIEGGYGQPNSEGFMTVTPFGDYLYLGTVVYPGYFTSLDDMMGTEILRVDAQGNVDLLVGEPRNPGTAEEIAPLSGYASGFNYDANIYTWDTAVHDGWLYVGTFDVAGLGMDFFAEWFPNGTPEIFLPVVEQLLGEDQTRWGGFDFYRTRDGIVWETISQDGFNNIKNYGIRVLKSTPWGLLLGAANPYDGFELWLGRENQE